MSRVCRVLLVKAEQGLGSNSRIVAVIEIAKKDGRVEVASIDPCPPEQSRRLWNGKAVAGKQGGPASGSEGPQPPHRRLAPESLTQERTFCESTRTAPLYRWVYNALMWNFLKRLWRPFKRKTPERQALEAEGHQLAQEMVENLRRRTANKPQP